ncbi:UNVERIFIED_CONTAM: hypothetical protein FKN15_011496 [Acipenser sinensis]
MGYCAVHPLRLQCETSSFRCPVVIKDVKHFNKTAIKSTLRLIPPEHTAVIGNTVSGYEQEIQTDPSKPPGRVTLNSLHRNIALPLPPHQS